MTVDLCKGERCAHSAKYTTPTWEKKSRCRTAFAVFDSTPRSPHLDVRQRLLIKTGQVGRERLDSMVTFTGRQTGVTILENDHCRFKGCSSQAQERE